MPALSLPHSQITGSDQKRALDGLLAQTLIAGLRDSNAPTIKELLTSIEDCCEREHLPGLRLIEQANLPAVQYGGPEQMGLVDFATPSSRAPAEKSRWLVTLLNGANGAVAAIHHDFEDQAVRWIDLGPGIWAGNPQSLLENHEASLTRQRSRIPIQGRSQIHSEQHSGHLSFPRRFLSLNADATVMAVALGNTLWVHPLGTKPEAEVSFTMGGPWTFPEPIHWIEFDRCQGFECLVVLRSGTCRLVRTCGDNTELQDHVPFIVSQDKKVIAFSNQVLWVTARDGRRLEGWKVAEVEHNRPPAYQRDLSPKGSLGGVSCSADGRWLGWIEPYSGTVYRIDLEHSPGQPEEVGLHDGDNFPNSVYAVQIDSEGRFLTFERQVVRQSCGQVPSLRFYKIPIDQQILHSAHQRIKEYLAGDDSTVLFRFHGWLYALEVHAGQFKRIQDRFHGWLYALEVHAGQFKRIQEFQNAASFSGCLRHRQGITKIQSGLACVWQSTHEALERSLPVAGITAASSAGDHLFVAQSSVESGKPNSLLYHNGSKLNLELTGIVRLLAAHASGKALAITHSSKVLLIDPAAAVPACLSLRFPDHRRDYRIAVWSPDGNSVAILNRQIIRQRGCRAEVVIVLVTGRDRKIVEINPQFPGWANKPERVTGRDEKIVEINGIPTKHRVSALALANSGDLLFGTDVGWIGWLDSGNGHLRWLHSQAYLPVQSIQLSDDGRFVIVRFCDSRVLHVFDCQQNKLVGFLNLGEPDSCVVEFEHGSASGQLRMVRVVQGPTIQQQQWAIET